MSLVNKCDAGDQHQDRSATSATVNALGGSRAEEDFEQSFSELFASASERIKMNDIDAESDFYESVRQSLGRLRDQYDFASGDAVANPEWRIVPPTTRLSPR